MPTLSQMMACMAHTEDKMDNALGMMFASALQAQANRPQKTVQRTVTTEAPMEVEDMRARRDTVGQTRQALADSLKKRETFGYNLANSLANLGGQTIPGQIDWLGGMRAFGNAFNGRTNAEIDRAQKDYDAARMDLADALMYDKAMGTRQVQDMDIGYTGNLGAVSGEFGIRGAIDPQKLGAGADWIGMLGFDERRPDAESYRKQSQIGRNLENRTTFAGSAKESAARDEFDRSKMLKLADARGRLKGTGTITDFEDKKYSEDVSKIKDPVALYDYTFNWANNLAAVRAGVIPVEDVLFSMGITPDVIEAYGIPKVARK